MSLISASSVAPWPCERFISEWNHLEWRKYMNMTKTKLWGLASSIKNSFCEGQMTIKWFWCWSAEPPLNMNSVVKMHEVDRWRWETDMTWKWRHYKTNMGAAAKETTNCALTFDHFSLFSSSVSQSLVVSLSKKGVPTKTQQLSSTRKQQQEVIGADVRISSLYHTNYFTLLAS